MAEEGQKCRPHAVVKKIPAKLKDCLGQIGVFVATYPLWVQFSSVLVTTLCFSFLGRLIYIHESEALFVPHGAPGLEERKIAESLFAMDYGSDYTMGHETRFTSQVLVIIKSTNSTMHLDKLLEFGTMIDELLKEIQVKTEFYGIVKFDDVCAKTRFSQGDQCQDNSILSLSHIMASNGYRLKYPKFYHPVSKEDIFLPSVLGDCKMDAENFVENASALRLFYILDVKSDPIKAAKAKIWEEAALQFLSNLTTNSLKKFEDFQVLPINSISLERDMSDNIEAALDLLFFSTFFLSIFLTVNGMFLNKMDVSYFFVASTGVLNAVMGSICGWGLTVAIGIHPWQAINLASIFLLLGVGIDDTFVMLSAWHRCRNDPNLESLTERLRETYKDAAVSITITSMTNICSFCIGMLVPSFQSVSIFCAYTASSLFFIYVCTLTFYGGVIACLDRHNLFTKIGQKIPLKVRKFGKFIFVYEDQKSLFTRIFQDVLVKMVTSAWFQVIVILVWMASSIFCGYQLGYNLKEGFEQSRVTQADSLTGRYFVAEDDDFRSLNYRIQVIIADENLEYSSSKVQNDIRKLLDQVQNLPLISNNTDLVENWLETFTQKWIIEQNMQVSNETEFISELKSFFKFLKKKPLPQNVKFSQDEQSIIASRFVVQTQDIADTNMEKELVLSLRQVADQWSHLNVTMFHPYFPYFDQFIQIRELTIECIAISFLVVMVMTYLLIPNCRALFILTLMIFSIMVQVVGLMTVWGVYLDVISLFTLIMCIGFSIDFCAHVANHFFISDLDNVDARIHECLMAYGPPILQGAISTLLGVLPLATTSSYILTTFSKMVFLVISAGVYHGLIILPVMMAMLQKLPWPCAANAQPQSPQEQGET